MLHCYVVTPIYGQNVLYFQRSSLHPDEYVELAEQLKFTQTLKDISKTLNQIP